MFDVCLPICLEGHFINNDFCLRVALTATVPAKVAWHTRNSAERHPNQRPLSLSLASFLASEKHCANLYLA